MNIMKELTVQVENSVVVAVNGLGLGQCYSYIDNGLVEFGIGTIEYYRDMYERQDVSEFRPLVMLSDQGVKEWRVADGYNVTFNEYEKKYTHEELVARHYTSNENSLSSPPWIFE